MEKQNNLEISRMLRFVVNERVINGFFIAVNNGMVRIRVIEDSKGIYYKGDEVTINKFYLEDWEDILYIELQEYSKFNLAQKLFGKHYIGLVLLITCFAAVIWSLIT